MKPSRHCSVYLDLLWKSEDARHRDSRYLTNANLWRDYWPGDLAEALTGLGAGEKICRQYPPGTLVDEYNPRNVHTCDESRFLTSYGGFSGFQPFPGRFFPRAMAPGVGGTTAEDVRAMRVIDRQDNRITVDFNHPLAKIDLELEATLAETMEGGAEHGGRCNDIPELATGGGPGMQAPYTGLKTQFTGADGYRRRDEEDDSRFYRQARLVDHLDAATRGEITRLHGRLIPPGSQILDLMASTDSHLPPEYRATGLGLNQEELDHNPQLTGRVIHDLNDRTELPFTNSSFDAAICTASVEYLSRPQQVFSEIARILKSGSPFVVTFSNRWFPTKAIAVWEQLHPFERMGLVLEFFRETKVFSDLNTWSLRGLPRPAGDKYHGKYPHADPLFAVWGHKK